ncbi:phosphomethylpyrimidine synthase ThiC [Nitratireductor sp. GCM10026969]|uniref:phosphomethylpyrimidine synthase ThiC n=1 Tax=Nitratireductor sp. GCM10026969 TaxID=3252645 RepID=UPI003621E44A
MRTTIPAAQLVREVCQAAYRGEAAAFIGSGISVPSGLPNWTSLLRPMLDNLGIFLRPSGEDLPLFAQHLVNLSAGNRGALVAQLKEAIQRRGAKPNYYHRAIARSSIELVWTTNYDTLLEQAYGAYPAIVRARDTDMSLVGDPDAVADLSLAVLQTPLWRRALTMGFAAASLPIYTVRRQNGKVDSSELLDKSVEQMEGGVGILTIHPTARLDIIDLARRRLVPWTSRGGGVVMADLLARDLTENVYLRILPDIVSSAKKHGTVLSLGASFRSANIFDSLDAAQWAEVEFQIELANMLRADGCDVIIESPGHARPAHIREISRRLSAAGHPVMPLGPIPTDVAAGEDHVSAAIGATLMGLAGAAHILAAVTREEHTGGIPSTASTLEAVRASRVAAHVIDIDRLGDVSADELVVRRRAQARTCVAGRTRRGCDRCADVCPLWSVLEHQNADVSGRK